MTRVINPTTYLFGGCFLVCPDCGRVHWESGTCRGCGAHLIGPWKRSPWVDVTVRTWVILPDGRAELIAPESDPAVAS